MCWLVKWMKTNLSSPSVTTIVSGDDQDDEASDDEAPMFDDNPLDSNPLLPHDEIHVNGLDEAHDSLIHEASAHAAI